MSLRIGDLCVCYGDICLVVNTNGVDIDVLMNGGVFAVQTDWCQKLTKKSILRSYECTDVEIK